MAAADKNKTLLIVDDDEGVCFSIKQILYNKFEILLANSAKKALEIIHHNSNGDVCSIDLVISDICMNEMDGLDLLKAIKKKNPRVEVILMTGFPNPDNTVKALRLGASDYIIKPFQAADVLDAVQRVVDRRRESVKNEKMIEDLRIAIQRNYTATTEALIMAIDAKDNYTKEHCTRVADLMVEFSREIGLDEEKAELLWKVGSLHDIGKIGIKEEILNKPGQLTPAEWDEMKSHAYLGYRIIQPVEFLGEARDVVLYHQERFDGTGYPKGLKGGDIPIGARMLAIVDSFDAMVTDRPYRKKLPFETVLAELDKNSGTQFDPKLVKVFIKMIKEKITSQREN